MKRVLDRLSVLIAAGAGLGYSPIASGTAGSLWGILLVVALWTGPARTWPLQAVVAGVLALAAVPVCGRAERVFGRTDDGRIVADEYLAFPCCMIGLPVGGGTAWLLIVAFLAFRFFDIVKPWPARKLQDLPGGWGVVADDVMAALYALAVGHLAYALVR